MSKRNHGVQAKKRGWKQWTPAKAQRTLAAWERSGLPLATYARQHGFGAERLRWWRNRLRGEADTEAGAKTTEAPPRFVPAVVTAPLVALSGAAVSIRLPGGPVLEISDVRAVPPDWVVELFAAASRATR
jgi:transposase-like protein